MNPNVEKQYAMGEALFFYDDKRRTWKKGTALVRLGKTIYLKYGNFLRRVAIDKVRPDATGNIEDEEACIDVEDKDEEAERFLKEETPVVEMAEELDLATKCSQLKAKVTELENVVEKNREQNQEKDRDQNSGREDVKELDEKEKIQLKRKLKRQRQKENKSNSQITLPKTGEEVLFKNKKETEWHRAKVIKTFKKTSIYKNYRHLKLENGNVIEKDMVDEVDWRYPDEEEQSEEFEQVQRFRGN